MAKTDDSKETPVALADPAEPTPDEQHAHDAAEAAASRAAEEAAKAAEHIGDIVIVIGRKIAASASEEDPAIVNLITEFPVLPPTPTVFLKGVPQPKPPQTRPDNVVCYVAATLFPQGIAPQNVRNVPLYASREEALKAPRGAYSSTDPDGNLAAYPKP